MSRAPLQLSSIVLLATIAACGGAKGIETSMLDNPPGTIIVADSGHGSGGHLLTASRCHVDSLTQRIVCAPLATADSGMGSGGHRPAVMIMTCEADASKAVSCSAPLSKPH